MARFEGITESIVYRNDTNGWTVATIKLDSPGRVTAVGVMPFLSQGTNVVLEGEWTNHPEYGKRISVTSYEVTRPQTESAIEKYLGSGAIRGIKSSMAKRIVKHFGEETLDVMEAHPERLIEVSGIGPKTMRMIAASFREQNEARGTMMFLQSYALSLKAAMRVQRAYGDLTERAVRSNPYRSSDETDGIGFQTADGIARALGFGETSDFRLSSGIRYCLSEAVNGSGHMFLPRGALLDKAAEVLNVTQELCENCLNAQIVKGDLIAEDVNGYHAVYLPKLYRAEKKAAELLLRHRGTIRPRRNASTLAKEIERYEKREGVSLCEAQRRAVICAAKDGMAIVTGGPGTGKTTSINCIIRLLEGENIALCAPTGRAAKRMSEATGMEARTIHRLLEYAGEDGFQRDEENPIEADYVIVDEVSMIDIFLFTALLRALRPGTGLILVGDADQLPSVGAGNVLRDLIAAEAVPVVCLTEIFRQAQESMIVVNAHRINHGEMPVIRVKDTDFFL
ncbi:MAG: AAA family ATPase, partial [Clostridia bacterium]|nr:AAA family ATPase [Clostridia bacterium]